MHPRWLLLAARFRAMFLMLGKKKTNLRMRVKLFHSCSSALHRLFASFVVLSAMITHATLGGSQGSMPAMPLSFSVRDNYGGTVV